MENKDKTNNTSLLDASFLYRSGVKGILNLMGSYAITEYENSQCKSLGILVLPQNTTIIPATEAPTWTDFTNTFFGEKFMAWSWTLTVGNDSSTTGLNSEILYSFYGFGTAPCGHTGTIQLALPDGVRFLFCNGMRIDPVDFSNATAMLLNPFLCAPVTHDKCLGQNTKPIQEYNYSKFMKGDL